MYHDHETDNLGRAPRSVVSESERPDPRRVFWFITIGTLSGVLVGAIVMAEALYWELLRLEPWAIAGVWVSDIVALVWFAVYVATRRSESGAHTTDVAPTVDWRGIVWFTITVSIGIAIDAWFTMHLEDREQEALSRAVPGVAQVNSISRSSEHPLQYRVVIEYQDGQGRTYRGSWRMNEKLSKHEEADLLRRPLRIKYDPLWPERFWPPVIFTDGSKNRILYQWSMLTLSAQGLFSLMFVLRSITGDVQTLRAEGLGKAIPFLTLALFGWLMGLAWLMAFAFFGW